MAESIIGDWIFATAIGATGNEMKSFLAVREALRRAEARGYGLDEALASAESLGRWAQLYLSQDLCRIVHSRAVDSGSETAKRILLELLRGEEPSMVDLAAAVLDLASEADPIEIIGRLEHTASHWLEREDPTDYSTALEYTDVEFYLIPTITLAMAITLASENIGLFEFEENNEGIAVKSLNALTAAALAGRYARLAFLGALDLAMLTPKLVANRAVEKALAHLSLADLTSSPDLLARMARFLFQSDVHASKSRQMERLAEELATLHVYRSRLNGEPHSTSDTCLVLWSHALFELMIEIDAMSAASIMSVFWRPRFIDSGQPAPAEGPPISSALTTTLLSPWLARKAWGKQSTTERLRSLCGVVIDIRILEGQDFGPPLAPFALHVLACISFLHDSYRGYDGTAPANDWHRANDNASFGNLGWIGDALLQSSRDALSGEGRVPPPNLLSLARSVGDAPLKIPALNLEGIDQNARRDLLKRIVTGAIRLVEAALDGTAHTYENPWLSLADQVVNLHKEYGSLDSPANSKGALTADPEDLKIPQDIVLRNLIACYIVGDTPALPTVEDAFLKGARARHWSGTSHRRLLLAHTNNALAWSDAPLEQDMEAADSASSTSRGLETDLNMRLALALQRVTVAKLDGTLAADVAQSWREDLGVLLQQVTDPKDFDRFSRLKLIRMISDGTLAGDQDLLFRSVATTINFCGPVHIRELLRAFTSLSENRAWAIEARIATYLTITRYLDGKFVRRDRARASAKERLLHQMRASCLLVSMSDLEDYAALLDRAKAERDADCKAGETPLLAKFPVRALEKGRYEVTTSVGESRWLATTTANMLALDVSSDECQLVHWPSPNNDAINGFANSPTPHAPRPRLGNIEFAGAAKRRPGTELDVLFASGDSPVKLFYVGTNLPKFGDLAVFGQISTEGGHAVQIGSDSPRPIKPQRIADLASARVEHSGAGARLLLYPADGSVPIERDTFNFCALLSGEELPYPIVARGHFEMELDLSDLLIDFPTLGRGDGVATLSLHAIEYDEDGQLVDVVLEARPLQRYRILVELQLTASSREMLDGKIRLLRETRCDPRGLLISVMVTPGIFGPLLNLTSGAGANQKPAYEALEFPFDQRNLWWRDLFLESPSSLGVLWVTRGADNTFASVIAAPRAGFPKRVKVELEGRSNKSGFYVEPTSRSWKPGAATLIGSPVETKSLDLPSDLSTFISDLDGLKAGVIIKLGRIAKTVRAEGRVTGYTRENLAISINAESLSMKRVFNAQLCGEGRDVLLSHVSWRRVGPTILIDLASVPNKAFAPDGTARAYLWRIPAEEISGSASCGVVWFNAESGFVQGGEILISNFSQWAHLRNPQGARVEVKANGSHLRELFAVGDAMWKNAGEQDAGAYIGSSRLHGRLADIYEVGAGLFATKGRHGAEFSARETACRFFEIDPRVGFVPVDGDGVDRDQQDRGYGQPRRCAIIAEGSIIAGTTAAPSIRGRIRVNGLHLNIIEGLQSGTFLLERRFQLQRDKVHEPLSPPEPEQPVPEETADGQEAALKSPLTGNYNATTGRLIFKGSLRKAYPAGLQIAPARVTRAPLLLGEYYPTQNVTATLVDVKSEDQLGFISAGSFIDNPAKPFDALRRLILGANANRDTQSFHLNSAQIRLYFVGREYDSEKKPWYLFEWGFGAWIKLPASRVRYKHQEIETARFQMFFGDRISAADIVEDNGGDQVLVVWAIAPSRAHEIYRTGIDNGRKLVSLLNIEKTGGERPEDKSDDLFEPIVRSIEGFDIGSTRGSNTLVEIPHAKLDDKATTLLRARLAVSPKQRMLGRLDIPRFEATLGEEFVFRYTRMDLDDAAEGLSSGDLVFVEAGEIKRRENEIVLTIRHPGLHADDIARSFADIPVEQIQRRNFSWREDSLRDILDASGTNALRGSVFLVRMEVSRSENKHRHSLIRGSLPRNSAVVEKLLRSNREVLATYGGEVAGKNASSGSWLFELQPGVVVRLSCTTIKAPDRIHRGDLCRITDDGAGSFRVTVAAPSDAWFTVARRPIVALPRQNLRGRNGKVPLSKNWFRASFSVGDLPGLTAEAKTRGRQGKSVTMNDESFIAFMSMPHPKLAELIDDTDENLVGFVPGLSGEVGAGALLLSDGQDRQSEIVPSVKMVSMETPNTQLPTDWYLLSYHDVSAADLAWQVRRQRWRYHDDSTTSWKRDKTGAIHSHRQQLPDVTLESGPLFFEVLPDGRASLRHGIGDLRKYAVGLSALTGPLLNARQHSTDLPVVVAAQHPGGLFIELCPGRLVEMVADSARHVRYGESISLRHLAWEMFGPGDRLFIGASDQLDVLDPLAPTLDWIHGPRNAIAPRGALLQRDRASSDALEGVAVYGVAPMRIKIPSSQVEHMPDLAIIGGVDHLTLAPTTPNSLRNSTILVTRLKENRLCVHGLPNVEIRPERTYDWEADTLMAPAVRRNDSGDCRFDDTLLGQRIDLAGGALPFTVYAEQVQTKGASEPRRVLYVTRQYQDVRLIDDRIIRVDPCGEIGNTNWVQLSVGARQFAVHAQALFPGVPLELRSAAIAALSATRKAIWLWRHQGQIRSGHGEKNPRSTTVATVAVVGTGEIFSGLICEGLLDGALRWLPAQEAAVCDLTLEEAIAAFDPRKGHLQISPIENECVSILRHPQVATELQRLCVGAKIGAVPIQNSTIKCQFWDSAHVDLEWKIFPAQSVETGMIFAAAAPSAMRHQKRFAAEIAVRKYDDARRLKILAVPAHSRRPIIDAPAWLLSDSQPPWLQSSSFRFLAMSEISHRADELIAALASKEPSEFDWPNVRALTESYLNSQTASLLIGLALSNALTACAKGSQLKSANEQRRTLMRDLFSRAIRSIPLEPLVRWSTTQISPFTARRRTLMLRLLQEGNLETARAGAESWLSSVLVYGATEGERALAGAFATLLGVNRDNGSLVREASQLSQVVNATRPVRLATSPRSTTLDIANSYLRPIAQDLIDNGDLPLQPPWIFQHN